MKTEYEKCMAGEPFIGSRDPKIVEMILRTKRLLAQFNATDYADSKRRRELLCEMLGHVGKNVHVDIDFHCECGKHIFMGDKVIVNMNCTFVDNNRIDIGSNVLIASNVQIYTATHSTKVDERMVQDCPEGQEICRTYALPVRIEDGVWIGGGGCHFAWCHHREEQRYRGGECGYPFYSCELCGSGKSLSCDKTD